MKQPGFTEIEYGLRKKVTKREEFLNIMDGVIPWEEWVEFVRPFYPSGKHGKPPQGIEKMLRMYLLQCWLNLSDEGIEDAIYDSYAFRSFMKINFFDEQVPDATTLLKFRNLLEKNKIPQQFFQAINRDLESGDCMTRGGAIVDATIIQEPSSTKNATGTRYPEMKSTRKGSNIILASRPMSVFTLAAATFIHLK